jgi:hypothetical protein
MCPCLSSLTDADIPDGLTASNYLPLAGGIVTGDLTVNGSFSGGSFSFSIASTTGLVATNATTTNATSTNFFATTASTTNLFATRANIGVLSIGSLNLTSPLSVSSGGTGWASLAAGYIPFGNGSSALATSSSLFWDNSNSRLGIGTSPTYKLDIATAVADDHGVNIAVTSPSGINEGMRSLVTGAATANTALYAYATGATTNYGLRIPVMTAGANNWAIYVDAAAKSYFNGNISIGSQAAAYKLDVQTTVANDRAGSFENTAVTGANYGALASATGVGATFNTGLYGYATGATTNYGLRIPVITAGANNWAIFADAAAKSYFAGNIGIGQTSPTYNLDVTGLGHFTGLVDAANFVATSSSAISIFKGGFLSLASSTIGNGTQTGGLTISGGATTTGNAYFAGNVGIGTTSPSPQESPHFRWFRRWR